MSLKIQQTFLSLWAKAGKLPFPWPIRIGRAVAPLIVPLLKKRKHIAHVNLKLAYPELSELQHVKLLHNTMQENIIGLFETAFGWWGNLNSIQIHAKGFEKLRELHTSGRGVLLVGAHYTSLDLGGAIVANLLKIPVSVLYRPNNNPTIDQIILERRQKLYQQVIPKNDMRRMIRLLRNGGTLWYPADQDHGKKHSVFAPFFGQQAASLIMTTKLAQASGCAVMILGYFRDEKNHYHIECIGPLNNYPSNDLVADATQINQSLEYFIRKKPSQYMWVHRRFKTQPDSVNFYK
ncbi:MAG: lipid A biosynthesis acyltransferase [Pseudomonadota bacterium]